MLIKGIVLINVSVGYNWLQGRRMDEIELKLIRDRTREIRKKMEAPSPKIKPGHKAESMDFERAISPTSELNYRRSALRYFKNREIAEKGGAPVQFKSKSDMVQTRAGVFRMNFEKMKSLTGGCSFSFSEALGLLDEIEKDIVLLNHLAHDEQPRESLGEFEKESMKQRLGRFESSNPDWRRRLDDAMSRSVYWPVYLIQRITGCRTVELTHNVFVEPHESIEDGYKWLIHVNTGKRKISNQNLDESRIRIIKSFDSRLGSLEGESWGIGKQSSYQSLFRNTCLRVLKEDFSPYSLRYAVAADLRDAGLPLVTQAEFLGHQDAETAKRYPKGMGHRGREYPATLETPRVKVQPRNISNKLKERIEQNNRQKSESQKG